jgi:probable HAF family extracellular repeat protein
MAGNHAIAGSSLLLRTRTVAERAIDSKEATVKPLMKRFVILAAALLTGVAHGSAFRASQPNRLAQYHVSSLPSLGGTISRGNSINNRGWVAGYSNLAGNQSRHATLWLDGTKVDLRTLGGPNSSVAWPVKNNVGRLAGITQTATPDPLGENWSCSAFFPPATATGFVCLGFVWESGVMRPLPTLGGNNGFATGSNDLGQTVGWAENTVVDPTCAPPQVLQFKAVIWGPGKDQIQELPLIPGDTSSAATAINDRGQVVGISGTCDQAVGRYTAAHAVLWERGTVTDIGNLGRLSWNTPMALNQRGDIVGFAAVSDTDPDNPQLHAFLLTRGGSFQDLDTLPGDLYSEAHGINERRQVVGVSCKNADGSGVCRAFLWQDGVMTDLNTLVAPGYTNFLTTAQDINDLGAITGRAFDPITGERPAFLATPILARR